MRKKWNNVRQNAKRAASDQGDALFFHPAAHRFLQDNNLAILNNIEHDHALSELEVS